jgi:hypothetical protein
LEPGRYDITIHQRATFKRVIDLPIDLSGHEVYAQIWDEKRRNKVADFEITMLNATLGQFEMKIDWQDTTLFKKAAFWDLQVVYGNGDRDYWLEGEVTIDPGLTAKEDSDA